MSGIAGLLFKRIKQPQVVGEMAAGILLGPSVLGWAAPALSHALFPASSLGYLNALCQVGLVLFMFLVGVSLDPKELRRRSHAVVLTSHASIVAPFCLGSALALALFERLSNAGVSFVSFALFMGVAMSITAFPVLARILAERNLLHGRIGTLSIACAAVDDVTGWCILAYIVVLIRSGPASMPAWMTVGGSLAYFMQSLQHKMESITVTVLLPLFFAFSGLRTDIGAIRGAVWLYALLVIVVAIAGKFGGSMFAARMAGISWRDAVGIGILMNTRGLMGLVALNIGLDIGVISQTVFAIMVLMALVTTFMTSPLLDWLYGSAVALDEGGDASHGSPARRPISISTIRSPFKSRRT